MLSGILFSYALAVSLFVQGTASVYVGPLLALLLGAAALGERRKDYFIAAWLLALLASALILVPVWKAPILMVIFMVLLVMPVTALSAPRHALTGCLIVLAVFALNLIGQKVFWPTEMFGYLRRAAWPLDNPNNAAQLMAAAFILTGDLYVRTGRRIVIALIAVFIAALWSTGSYGGWLSAAGGFLCYVFIMRPEWRLRLMLAAPLPVMLLAAIPQARHALTERFPIWQATHELVSLKGSGIGTFHQLYPAVRTESYTAGLFAHNDVLQLAIEMGWPLALVFVALAVSVAWRTRPNAAGPAAALFALFISSMTSFPFYVPSISIFAGVLLATWWGKTYARSVF